MLSVKNLSKTYGARGVFDSVSFKLANKSRTALVGLNGTGKSTLLRIILGQEKPDSGLVEIKTEKISYVPQIFKDLEQDLEKVISDNKIIPNRKEYSNLKKIFELFKIDDLKLDRKISSLSGGQQTKLFLSIALSMESNLLILDEPTNNLDLEALVSLEYFLKTHFQGALLVVSHDRRFMDSIVDSVIELKKDDKNSPSKVSQYSGNYSDYVLARKKEQERAINLYRLQQRNIKNIEDDIRKTKQQALKSETETTNAYLRGRSKKVAKKAKVRELRLEKRLESEEHLKKPLIPQSINFNPEIEELKKGQLMLAVPKFDLILNNNILIKNVSLNLYAGDKKALLGENGSGKTTFLKKIVSDYKILRTGEKTKMGYVPQIIHFNDKDKNCVEYLKEELSLSDSEARRILAKVLMRDREVYKTIGSLSQGQKLKLQLAKIIGSGANLLLLDEPTNNLDLESIEEIEKGLRNFQGSFLVISHDRYFLNNIGISDILYVTDREIKHESSISDLEKYILTKNISGHTI